MADAFTPNFVDLVRNYTTSTGTGDFKLGPAVNGYTGFTAALQVGDKFYYAVLGVDRPSEREVGRGTLLANGIVARDPVSGTKTNFTSGTKTISLVAAAEWFNTIQAGGGAAGGGGTGTAPATMARSRAELSSIATQQGAAMLCESGREGLFVFDASDLSAAVTADTAQAMHVAPASDPTGASGAWVRRYDGPVFADWFGAKGDGTTDDSAAFAAFNAFINAADGGSYALRPGATYIIGAQTLNAGAQFNYPPDTTYIIHLDACTKPVVVRGNGAIIKCKAGAKYGAFNDDGTPMASVAPYTGNGISTPYYAMVRAHACSGGVWIENLELDGNIANATIGGEWASDAGRQIQMCGVILDANTCGVTLSNVRAHHHGQDGFELFWAGATEDSPRYPVTLLNCDALNNGRQGLSWVGGKAVTAINCRFNDTGRDIGAMAFSPPGAGLDIEAEGAICDAGHFIDCEFSNNAGFGVLHVFGVSNITYDHCKFIGTTSSSFYGNAADPFTRFNDCTFVGQLINVCPSTVRPEATKFNRCNFLFGTARSPTGEVFTAGGTEAVPGWMFNLGGSGAQNIEFSDCLFDTEGNLTVVLGWMQGAGFHDCEFTQDSATYGIMQYSRFTGINKITGNVDRYLSKNCDVLTVNGVTVARHPGDNADFYTLGSIYSGYDGFGNYGGGELGLRANRNTGLTAQVEFDNIGKVPGNGASVAYRREDAAHQLLVGLTTGSDEDGFFGTLANIPDRVYFLTGNGSGAAFAIDFTKGLLVGSGAFGVSGEAGSWNASGDIAARNIAATGTVGGSNLSGTNTGDETAASIVSKSSGQALTPASVAATGAITSSGGGIGYATGAGGAVTQATSKATAVTLNKLCGQITMNGAALAANTAVTFTLTNSQIAAGDRIVLNHMSGGTFGAYLLDARSAAGSATVMVRNVTAGSLSEAIVLGFSVVKGVTA